MAHGIVRGVFHGILHGMTRGLPLGNRTFFSIPSTTVGAGFGRPTTLITPDSFDPTVARPLMVVLHAFGETPASIQARLGLTGAQFFDNGCLMLVPAAVNDSGGNKFWNYWDTANGDFAFLPSIIAEVKSRFAVSHVWGVGYSNGGFMTIQLMLQNPTLYDALFTFDSAGGVNDSTAVAPKAISHFHFHVSTDEIINYNGDATGASLPVPFTGHGGVGSSGYVSAINTVTATALRNGVTGSLGAAGTAFDFTTVAGNETSEQVYSNTSANPISLFTASSGVHAIQIQNINAASPGNGTLIFSRLRAAAP